MMMMMMMKVVMMKMKNDVERDCSFALSMKYFYSNQKIVSFFLVNELLQI
jgi:hypothetical protein